MPAPNPRLGLRPLDPCRCGEQRMDGSVSPCQGPAHCLLPALQHVTPLPPPNPSPGWKTLEKHQGPDPRRGGCERESEPPQGQGCCPRTQSDQLVGAALGIFPFKRRRHGKCQENTNAEKMHSLPGPRRAEKMHSLPGPRRAGACALPAALTPLTRCPATFPVQGLMIVPSTHGIATQASHCPNVSFCEMSWRQSSQGKDLGT